jgi:Xaa-Pro aminopeptidase
MNFQIQRTLIVVFLCTALLITVTANDAAKEALAQMWHVAPSAPKVAEIDRVTELRKRRAEVMKRMSQNSVMVLFSTEPRIYTYDVDYHYRQENNLYYLTGIKQPDCTLVLLPQGQTIHEILFVPERNPQVETWNGKMMSNDEARARSGVQEVWDARLLNGLLAWLSPKAEQAFAKRGNVSKPNEQLAAQWQREFGALAEAVKNNQSEFYLLPPPGRDLREYRPEHELATALRESNGWKTKSAHNIFAELRVRKSPWEIKLLQHATDITAEAFHRVFAVAGSVRHEYEVQAEFEYTFKRRGADSWGYPCIVGGGANATTLHYITNQEALADDSLLLMDCAAEYDHYTADITRTIPLNGEFSQEQADIYRIVYEAQEASIKRVRAGAQVGSVMDEKTVQGATAEVIKEGLFKLGLITSKSGNQFRVWYMHGSSHWIGMNVHDVGDYRTPLEPGMVLTVEPGIYIRPDALDVLAKAGGNEEFIKAVRPAFEKYKGIGVRIEDDILVTTGDPVNMSVAIPRKLEDVEAAMARLRRELKTSGWPTVSSK